MPAEVISLSSAVAAREAKQAAADLAKSEAAAREHLRLIALMCEAILRRSESEDVA
jgi:hypothetical protein